MRNGYFQLVSTPGGFGIKFYPPLDGGEPVKIAEVLHYLEEERIPYDLGSIKRVIDLPREEICVLGQGQCPVVNEKYRLDVSGDYMSASIRFFAPSETGVRLNINEVFNDLRFRNIVSGIQIQTLQNHFMSMDYFCRDLLIAKGREPKHGPDDKIEYNFNTDVHAKPDEREDGTVDYYNLNMINHCKKGDVLARIVRGEQGEPGVNILGKPVPPREQKRLKLKHGKNITLAEDGMSITSQVDGHVMLVDDNVFVSDLYVVENVDTSTGNIEYTGSVQINGNVSSNFMVKARGNVIINGVVEGAQIEAGGNIVIARGMNGMGKGVLKAGGNVIAKFLENATVEADGYVSTGSILHSNVNAGTEIEVTGKKGFITGGHVQASKEITVKTLGATMGAATVVEVGMDPRVKTEYAQIQKEVVELVKSLKAGQLVVANFSEKRAKGARISEDQIKFVRDAVQKMEQQKKELEEKNARMQELREQFELQRNARVVVKGEVHPGTTVIIGELSMVVQSMHHFCKFEVVHGDVKAVSM